MTPSRPANSGITDFDVHYGSYLLQYDDQELFHQEVQQFDAERAQEAVVATRKRAVSRVPAPSNAAADVTSAKRSALEETALDRLLREEEEREAAKEHHRLAQLQNLGEQIIHYKPKALPENNELRNLHQVPLAARGLIAPDARPMVLHRIGVLPGQSREVGEIARMLDTWHKPLRRRFNRSSKEDRKDDDEDDSAGYIDMLEETYERFGTDVNYISPTWLKAFTRRLSKWKGHIDEDFVLLSPWQGHLVFQSSKVRNSVTCFHIPPNCDAGERHLVSELKLNVYPQAKTRRSERPSSSDEGSISPLQWSAKPFPTRLRARGVSESSPLSSVTAAAASSEKRDSRMSRIMQKVQQVTPRAWGGRREPSSGSEQQPSSMAAEQASAPLGQEGKGKRGSLMSLASIKAQLSSGDDASSPASQENLDGLHASAPSAPTMSGDLVDAISRNSSQGHLSPSQESLPSPTPLDAEHAAENARMDLSLGQEKLGGGLRGRDAKLAKIVVYGEGQQMLDLVVAANMILFRRAYLLSRGEVC